MLYKKSALATLSILSLALSACGGGSGGGGASTNTSTPSTTLVAISNSNAPAAAGTVSNATDSAAGSGTASSAILSGVAIGDNKRMSLAQLAQWQLSEINKQSTSPDLLTGAQINNTVSCPAGGSETVEFNDINDDKVASIGEQFNITFNNCVAIAGTAPISGKMSMTLNEKSGLPGSGSWSMKASLTLTNLSMGNEKTSGDMTMAISSSDNVSFTIAMKGKSLSDTTISTNKESVLSNYDMTILTNETTNAYTLTGSGTASSNSLAGAVSFTTPTALQGNFNNNPDNPTSGVIMLSGTNNSKLRITAIDKTYVELAVDANGDGTYETTSTRTWAEIEAL